MSERLQSPEKLHDRFVDFVEKHYEESRYWQIEDPSQLLPDPRLELGIIDHNPVGGKAEPVIFELIIASKQGNNRGGFSQAVHMVTSTDPIERSGVMFRTTETDDLQDMDPAAAAHVLDYLELLESDGRLKPLMI